MGIIYRFALSLCTLACLSIVLPPWFVHAREIPGAITPKTTAPKADPVPKIVNQEMALLKLPQTPQTKLQLENLYRQLVADALQVHHRAGMKNVSVPSSMTTNYFGDLYQVYPQSGLLAILYAESLAAQPDDFGQVMTIYQAALKAHPNHPLLAKFYANYRKAKPTAIKPL